MTTSPGRHDPRASCALALATAALLAAACARPGPPEASIPVPLPSSPSGTGEERVALRFAWPEGFAARVRGAESRRLTSDAGLDTTRSEMAYRLRVETAETGSRIRYEEFSLPCEESGALVPLRRVPGLEDLADALRPSFVVGPDGRFLGTPDLDATVARVNRELDVVHGRAGGLPQGAPTLPTRFSGELFRRHAPVEWFPMVEMWAGREIVLGGRYDLDLVTRMPLLDGATLRMDGELFVSGRQPCEDGGPPRCVELRLETKPDLLEMLPLLGDEGSRREAGGAASTVTVTRLDLRETVRLLTEPETLVPRRLETRQRASITVRLPDGSLHTDALDRESDLVFHPET